jgi:hypothetical protein
MMSLEELVETLEEYVARAEENLEARIVQNARDFPNVYANLDLSPEDMRDGNGRFILLDAQVELVKARAVLAQLEGR